MYGKHFRINVRDYDSYFDPVIFNADGTSVS